MPIQVTCSCGRSFSVPESYGGKVGKCSACGKGVTIPRPPAIDDEGLLPLDLPQRGPHPQRGPVCALHPQRLARGACSVCGKLLCQGCLSTVEGTHYCPSCMTTSQAFRGGGREERTHGLVTKSYKAYFNANTALAAIRSARLTVMNGWFLWAFMVGLCFFLTYLEKIAWHFGAGLPAIIALAVVQFLALAYLECAFVACIRDGIFQKDFGIARFFHYGARYYFRYFLCYLAYYGFVVLAFVAVTVEGVMEHGSRASIVATAICTLLGIVFLNILFFYARLLVVLEDASPFAALRRSVAFGLKYWGKVLLLGLFTIGAGGLILFKGGCLGVFLPDWLAPMIRNLFVFLAIGVQIAACMLLYLSLYPDEDAYRKALPPDDVPEAHGPVALRTSMAVFFGVLALGFWVYHLPENVVDAFGQTHPQGFINVKNSLGETIRKIVRPAAKVRWKVDVGGPISLTPIAVGEDVLIFAKDTAQRRRASDGSLVWETPLPGHPAGEAVSDGLRAYVVCASAGAATQTAPLGALTEALVAIDLKDGKVAWKADLPDACTTAPIPEIAGDKVIVPSAFQLRAFSAADGREAWATAKGAYNTAVGPARAAEDGIYYAAQDDMVHVANPADGKDVRTMPYPALSCFRKPVVTKDSVYTTAGNTVVRLNRATGQRVWEHIIEAHKMDAEQMRLEVIEGRPLYHFGMELRTVDPASGAMGWVLSPEEGEAKLGPDGKTIQQETFVPDGFALDEKGPVMLANQGTVIGRVDMKEGKRTNMLDVPVDPAPQRGADTGFDWTERLGPTDPLLLGDSAIFGLRGKLYSVELPKP